jgi:phage shock protein C
MFCTACGTQLPGQANYCSNCGLATPGAPPRPAGFQRPAGFHRLSRSRQDKKVAGVCAGLARYFDVDPSLVRIVWLVLTLCPPFPGIVAYIVCWIVMPLDPWQAPWGAQNASTTPEPGHA